jgi:hydroxylamine dehydrogenase
MIRLSFILLILLGFGCGIQNADVHMSEDTQTCIDCHIQLHPNIISAWKNSRHSRTTPAQAFKRPDMEKRISSNKIPERLLNTTVGCAECHTSNDSKHKDTFDHNGYDVHIVVTPADCALCHSVEAAQYEKNLMSHAHGNLINNPLYLDLVNSINGLQTFKNMKIDLTPPDDKTNADSCLHCHGTVIKVTGTRTVETDVEEVEIPLLAGWPNQGVGRINPDGSRGSCAACHTRHQFSIEMARKPETCAQCHKGPDVPAYPVYNVSKHGNIFKSLGEDWNYKSVPWRVGEDFFAPTCAACHASLVVNTDGEIIAERTHQMNDRLPWRIFGLIYSHPHPKSPDTTLIKNSADLPLPTELTGAPVAEYLISADEQEKRLQSMQRVCLSCHGNNWVDGHFDRFQNTLKTTNDMTLTATQILLSAWETGAARGPTQKDGIFNEALEKMWVEQWLFYANSTRFASAMGGADYGAFANGRWYLSKNIQEMRDWLEFKQRRK